MIPFTLAKRRSWMLLKCLATDVTLSALRLAQPLISSHKKSKEARRRLDANLNARST
jgi:hypothetical protein